MFGCDVGVNLCDIDIEVCSVVETLQRLILFLSNENIRLRQVRANAQIPQTP